MLNLAGNKITDAGVLELCKGLQQNAKLEAIHLGSMTSHVTIIENNTIGNEGALALAELLKTNRSLTEIDICKNNTNKGCSGQLHWRCRRRSSRSGSISE